MCYSATFLYPEVYEAFNGVLIGPFEGNSVTDVSSLSRGCF